MWGLITYEPVAAFGLRPSNTTANGGKSLLCPTPYAIKMALLDRLIREYGETAVRAIFPVVRDTEVHVRVPQMVAVNRTFQKVQRLSSEKGKWNPTISQREFCIFAGELELALSMPDDQDTAHQLRTALTAINYFGQRGSFMQWKREAWFETSPDSRQFVHISRSAAAVFRIGFLQRMDDMLPDASFDDVSVMNPKAKGGRTSYTVVLPYTLRFHGANHTIYERTEVL